MKNFSDINIAVVGDIMLDKYIYGHIDNLSQEAPVPVVQVDNKKNTLGGAGNVAKNLFNLHVNTYLYGIAGQDDHGKELRLALELFKNYENPIRYRLITTEKQTTTKMRIIAGHQQIGRVDFEEIKDISKQTEQNIIDDIKNSIEFDIIIISDYGKGVCTTRICKEIIKIGKEKGIITIVDPKGHDWEKYRGTDIIVPNLKELHEPVSHSPYNLNMEDKGKYLRQHYNFESILITRAEKGMTLINQNHIIHIPTEAQEVYDVCGAGDTVIAVLAALLAKCLPIESAIKYANKAAGKVIQKLGTVPIEYNEMKEIMEEMTNEDQNQLC